MGNGMNPPSHIHSGNGMVKHWVLTVVAECAHCGPASTLMLLNNTQVKCPKCGAVHMLSGFYWPDGHPEQAEFNIQASEPTIARPGFRMPAIGGKGVQ